MKCLLALIAACVLLVPLAAPAQAQGGDEAAIRKNIDTWVQQYNQHDAAALTKWYGEQAVYVTPEGSLLSGPGEIQKYFEASFKRSPDSKISVQTKALTPVKPDVMLGSGTYEISGAMGPDGKPATLKGPWSTTMIKEGNDWKVLSHSASMEIPKGGMK